MNSLLCVNGTLLFNAHILYVVTYFLHSKEGMKKWVDA